MCEYGTVGRVDGHLASAGVLGAAQRLELLADGSLHL
jgi:hypothetical protein